MIKKRKVTALTLAAFMAVSGLAACSDDNGGQNSTTAPTTKNTDNSKETTKDNGEGTKETTTNDKGETVTPTTEPLPTAPPDANVIGKGWEEAFDYVPSYVPEKTVTLDVYSPRSNTEGIQQGWFAKVVKDKFNIELNIIPDDGGVFETRLAAGNLGDIVLVGNDNFKTAVKQGALLDWNYDDLLDEYGPYVKSHFATALAKNADMVSEATKGEIESPYGFGWSVGNGSSAHQNFMYTWDLRWDLYQQLVAEGKVDDNGIQDLDELFDVLVAMKELCPTDDNGNPTYALSLWKSWDGDMVMYVKSFVTAYYGYEGDLVLGHVNVEDGTYYNPMDKNGPYIEILKFFNKLHRAGLLDPDSLTNEYGDAYAKVQNGGVFLSIFGYAGSDGYNTPAHTEANKLMTCVKPIDATPIAYSLNANGDNMVWSIGVNTEHPELCMEFINWMCTPQGFLTSCYGPKGVTWDYDDEGAYMTELGELCMADSSTALTGDYAGMTFKAGQCEINTDPWDKAAFNPETGEQFEQKQWHKYLERDPYNQAESDWRAWASKMAGEEVKSVEEFLETQKYKLMIKTGYVQDDKSSDLKTTWSMVTEQIVNGTYNAMLAKDDAEFDARVDQMIKNAYDFGMQQCVDYSEKQCKQYWEEVITQLTIEGKR